jgi:hypothetical protein
MEADQSIAQLGERLDAWCDRFFTTLETKNRAAQGKALLDGAGMVQELDRLKAQGLAAITSLLNRRDAVADDERAALLIQGFEFAAKMKGALHDELRDTDGANKIVGLMNDIANALDSEDFGRTALAVLLDHPNVRVRATAGAHLINLMPERVVPILRDIEQKEKANSAHFTASIAVFRWEREGKQNSG